jgi:SAM-dependent methyltransferase
MSVSGFGVRSVTLDPLDSQSAERVAWSTASHASSSNRPAWGNYQANFEFLDVAGVLLSPLRILEIGCGRGLLLRHLTKLGHHVVGIDPNPVAVSECAKGVHVCVAVGEELPFVDASFDLVLGFDVFEHIPETDRLLSEVRRVLAREGYCLLQTPNKWTNIPFEMLRWSRMHGLLHMFDFLKPPEHCSLHNYWQLKRRLIKHGFRPEFYKIDVVNNYFRTKIEHFAGQPSVLLLRIFNPDTLPMPLRTNFYVKAKLVN